jgi:tRNA nucleotidyltransferase (CCA-adding enzyme)
VDRTPLHTKFIKENLQEKQKQEVRLFKQFLRGIRCYGAEAEIEGFSGYLCEILIIQFDTFNNLLKNVKNWKKGEKIALTKGKFQNFDTPLTFIDPVDTNRNVASAVSEEKFDLFIKASKEFMKQPSITFFFPNPVKSWSIKKIEDTIKKQNRKYVGIRFTKPDIIPENLYPQIRKAARSIKTACKKSDFKIHDTKFHIDEENDNVIIILKTDKEPLSNTMIHTGPPVKAKENSEDFLNKWRDNPRVTKPPFKKNGRLYVEIKREYIVITDFLSNQVKTLSMGKHLDNIIRKKYTIVEFKDLLKENLRIFWTSYLDKKMSWER